MTTIETARDLASRIGWLVQTSAAFRQAILHRSVLRDFAAGVEIYSVGDPPGGMYFLVSGTLRLTIATGSDGPFLAHLARPGLWLGQGPLISGQPRLIGLSAGRRSQLLHVPLPALQEVLKEDAGCWQYIAALTAMQIQTAFGVIEDLLIRDDQKRCIAVLLRIAGCRSASEDGQLPVVVDINQEDLAAMANLARTTVGGVLRKLEAAGHIRLRYRRVEILDPGRLRGLV